MSHIFYINNVNVSVSKS